MWTTCMLTWLPVKINKRRIVHGQVGVAIQDRSSQSGVSPQSVRASPNLFEPEPRPARPKSEPVPSHSRSEPVRTEPTGTCPSQYEPARTIPCLFRTGLRRSEPDRASQQYLQIHTGVECEIHPTHKEQRYIRIFFFLFLRDDYQHGSRRETSENRTRLCSVSVREWSRRNRLSVGIPWWRCRVTLWWSSIQSAGLTSKFRGLYVFDLESINTNLGRYHLIQGPWFKRSDDLI